MGPHDRRGLCGGCGASLVVDRHIAVDRAEAPDRCLGDAHPSPRRRSRHPRNLRTHEISAQLREHHRIASVARRRRCVQDLLRNRMEAGAKQFPAVSTHPGGVLQHASDRDCLWQPLALQSASISSMGKLLALSLVCTLTSAALFQPALMGEPRHPTGGIPN